MPSPIARPPTPILKGAGHLVVDCESMLAVNHPPPWCPVLRIADRERIWVTYGVDVTHEVGLADDVKIKYEVEARYEAEQVEFSLGFLKSPGLTIT